MFGVTFVCLLPSCMFAMFQSVLFFSGNQTVLKLCSVLGTGQSFHAPGKFCHVSQVIHCCIAPYAYTHHLEIHGFHE